mgnify:CR=1 FL=1
MRKTNKNVPADLRVKHRDKSDKIFYWVLLALPLLQIAVFYFGVNYVLHRSDINSYIVFL